ncbi:MAG: aminotransferase class III-fold pyridoxal phosphate-dependent enzyme [Actinobacteria bacterium]|nr:MAG: aminotransferase class III-fold pyridoxal phosphate-dependent enzyme [Actinomycetota bacterium]
MARLGGAPDRRPARPRPRRVRVPDALWHRRAARQPARPRRSPAADLRAVRRTLVRLLAAPAAGEPEDRRLHRRGHAGAARASPQRLRLIWADAQGCRVVDADGREYLDLSGGFGVAALGHRNPQVLEAWREQRVVHALGDLAEAEVTVELRRRLPWPAKLGVTGEDAVEIALRTALIATGKPGILAFEGAYHGTGLLALAATSIDAFRLPFRTWLPGPVYRRRFGDDPGTLPARCGCVIVEPVQARGGAQVASSGREPSTPTCWWSARRSATGCRSRRRSSAGSSSSRSGSSARRTSTPTRTRAVRSRPPPRSWCSKRCRSCSSAFSKPASASSWRAGTARAYSVPAKAMRTRRFAAA